MLVALFSEPDSHAVAFLKEEGITRLDVVSYISHGISKLLPAKTTGSRRAGARRQPARTTTRTRRRPSIRWPRTPST